MFYKLDGFDPRIVGWIVKYARQQYWRVQDFMELEDLIHEGFDCLLDARRRYSHYDQKRFMNTVKLMFSNHIPYLLNRNIRMPAGKLVRVLDFCEEERASSFYDAALGGDAHSEIERVIAEAPERIKPLLAAFIDPDSTIPNELARPVQRDPITKKPETLNEQLCRILGLDPSNDVCRELEEYLLQGT